MIPEESIALKALEREGLADTIGGLYVVRRGVQDKNCGVSY